MKRVDFINEMNNVHANEELILKTINCIENRKQLENGFRFKKILAGTVAAFALTVGTVGAYVGITGNTEILQKIGINLGQNYEQNEQEISEKNSNNSVISVDGVEAKLVSVALDNTTLVMEIDLNLNESIVCESPDLKVKNVNIYRASNQSNIGEDIVISEKSSVQKMEDGTYKLFKYISLSDPATSQNNFWEEVFYADETVQCAVIFEGLADEDGKMVVQAENYSDEWNFDFELTKPDNIISGEEIQETNTTFTYGNVDVMVESVQQSSFGNIITITATQENFNYDSVNDIQTMQFVVKDLQGNNLDIVSRTQNIVLADYENGEFTTVILEIQLIVDDTSNGANYIVTVEKDSEINVSYDEIKALNDEMVENGKSGDTVLTTDGVWYPMSSLEDTNEYYVDSYGVYRIDKSTSELDPEYAEE